MEGGIQKSMKECSQLKIFLSTVLVLESSYSRGDFRGVDFYKGRRRGFEFVAVMTQ